MNNKVILAVVLILVIIGTGGAYFYKSYMPSKSALNTTETPTPTDTENPLTDEQSKVETSTITVKAANNATERVIFHESAGVTFKSFETDGLTDRIMVYLNGNDLLQLGIDWVGYTEGSLELVKVVPVQNRYLGNLYRASGGGFADGSYVLASKTKTTGKCTGNGAEAIAPCTDVDQINSNEKNPVSKYLAVCMDLDQIAYCDQLMSGLEIKR